MSEFDKNAPTVEQVADQRKFIDQYSMVDQAAKSVGANLTLSSEDVYTFLAACLPVVPGFVEDILRIPGYRTDITVAEVSQPKSPDLLVCKAYDVMHKVIDKYSRDVANVKLVKFMGENYGKN